MGAAKGITGLIVVIIAIVFGWITLSNGMKNIEDAEQWTAYEHGVCLYVDGFSEQQCQKMAGPVQWPAISGEQAFEKYYGEGKTQWVYGENPRLGLGPLGN